MMTNDFEQILAVRQDFTASFKDAQVSKLCASYNLIGLTNGIAVIGAVGETAENSWYFNIASYANLRAQIEACLASKEVEGIMLLINSPGGSVGGLFETCEYIKSASKTKPIWSHVTAMGCSAAYALASSCQKIGATKTSEIGSVGVMCECCDVEKTSEKFGWFTKIFRSKNASKKNLSPMTKEGEKDLQEKLDFYEDCFYSHLSETRGIDKEKCIADFGNGAVFLAEEAQSRGMIDDVCSYEDYLEAFAASFDKNGSVTKTDVKGEEDMDITKLSLEEKMNVFTALITDNPTLLDNAREESVCKERERIKDLLAQKNDVNASIIEGAINDGKALNDIAMDLFKAEKENNDKLRASIANPMETIEAQANNSQEVAVPNETDEVKAKLQASVDKINKARAKA